MADVIKGLTIDIGLGTAKLDSGLKDLKKTMSAVNSEMKSNLSVFDHGEKSVDKYQTRIDGLNKKLEVQRAVVEKSEKSYKKMVEQHGEGSKEADNAARKYNQENAALNNLQHSIDRTTEELKEFERQQRVASSSWTKFGGKMKGLGDQMKNIGSGMQNIGKQMSLYITAPVVGLAGALFKTGVEYKAFKQESQQAFTVLLGSAEAATAHMERIMDFAKTTPFAFPDLVSANRKLVSFGMEAEKTEPVMEAIANSVAAMGGGSANIENLADIFAKITANGRVTGEELNRLGDEGVNALKILANQAGISMEDMRKRISDGAMGADEAIQWLVDGMMNGTKGINGETVALGGSLDKLKGTWAGAVDSMKGAWRRAGDAIVSDEMFSKMTEAVNKLTDLIGKLPSIIKPFADQFGDILSGFIDKASAAVDWFLDLDEGVQRFAIKLGIAAVAAGPVLVALGSLLSVLGTVATGVATVSMAIGAAGGLTAVLGTAGGALMTFATGPIGLTIAAVAGLTAGAIALGKYLSGPAIEEVDLFGSELEGVSDSTKAALSEFWTLSDGVDDALIEMKVSAGVVTEGIRDEVVGNFSEMHQSILDGMQQNHEDRMKILLESFEGYRYLTDQEQQEIIRRNEQHHQTQIEKQEQAEARIREIMETAYAENRKLTENEELEINAIKTQMQNDAIVQLSESAAEEAIIRQRLADTKGEISKKEAADLIARAAEVRDKTVQEAEKEYDERVATAIYMRDELGTISADQAEKIIRAAKDERDNTVYEAEQKYGELYDTTVSGNASLMVEIDRHTGQVRTKWQTLYRGLAIDLTKYATQALKEWKDLFSDVIYGATQLPKRMGAAFSAGAAAAGKGIADIGNNIIRTFEKAVNAVIDGVNTITSKLGFGKKLSRWNAGRIVAPRSTRSGNARPVAAYAQGTGAHPGGPMIVGDQFGRELVEFPNGKMWLTPDTDTLVPNAPPGTRVIPNELTEKLIRGDIPFYAKGAGVLDWLKNKASNIWDYATNPGKLVDSLISSALGGIGLSGGSGDIVKSAVKYVGKQAVDYVKGMFQKAGDFTGGKFGSPFRLTSRAGWRIHPIYGTPRFHFGDDYGAPMGTPVPSQSGGVVTTAGYHSARGNYIKVKSGMYDLIYQHLQKMFVSAGQAVTKGQTIGTVGSTGASTGPHLHFETWKNGKFMEPKSFGYATGGIVRSAGLYPLAEEGPEVVIPLAPNRRTDAMKLLAIAGRMLGGKDDGVRPNQLPGTLGGGDGTVHALLAATLQQNEILMQILAKDPNLYVGKRELARELADPISEFMQGNKARRDRFGTT